MWPQELQGVEDYKDGDGAMLGYVRSTDFTLIQC